MRLFTAGGRLALSVRDDGRGFDLEAVRRGAASGASLGLVGMEERIALAGGSFELRPAPGQGTVLLATFPAIFQNDLSYRIVIMLGRLFHLNKTSGINIQLFDRDQNFS